MKIIGKTLLLAGVISALFCATAFATEVQIVNDNILGEAVPEIQEINVIAETKQEDNKAKKGTVIVEILNVRSGTSTNTEKLGKLSFGTTVEILSESDGWYEINYESQKAYIKSEYVKIVDTNSANLNVSNIGSSIVDYAKKFIGTPYASGGSSPSGFDCSGYVKYVMANFGVTMPRPSTDQYSVGVQVKKSELLPGDLVFFKLNANSYGLSHVGIYVGDGNFIHSPVPGQSVKISPLNTGYFSYYYYGATRVLQ